MKVGIGLGSSLGERLANLQRPKNYLLLGMALFSSSCAHLGSCELSLDSSHNRAFHRETGLSPRAYRQQYRPG